MKCLCYLLKTSARYSEWIRESRAGIRPLSLLHCRTDLLIAHPSLDARLLRSLRSLARAVVGGNAGGRIGHGRGLLGELFDLRLQFGDLLLQLLNGGFFL